MNESGGNVTHPSRGTACRAPTFLAAGILKTLLALIFFTIHDLLFTALRCYYCRLFLAAYLRVTYETSFALSRPLL
jgi:hypothetical protein